MSKPFLPIFLFLAFAPLMASAQAPEPTPEAELPVPPFVARAPDFSAWNIEATPKRAASAEPSPTPVGLPGGKDKGPTTIPEKVLKTSVVTKTGEIIRDVRTYADGTRTESWWIHGFLLRQDPTDGHIDVIDPATDPAAVQFGTTDFDALGWLDLAHFARVESKRGVPCFVYEWKERMPTGADYEKLGDYVAKSALYFKFRGKPTTRTRVWIAKESRLPVASENEAASFAYNFLKPPTEPLTLPPTFQKEWDGYKALLDDWKSHVMPRQK